MWMLNQAIPTNDCPYFVLAASDRAAPLALHAYADAASMYDEAARKYHGEYATLNFPRDGERGARPSAKEAP